MALLLGWWWLAGKTLPLPPSGPESAVPVRTRRPENPPSVAPSPQRPEVEAGEAAFAQMKTTLAENRRAGMDQLAAMPASDELNVLVMRLLEDGVMTHRQAFDFITEMRDARWRDGMLKNLAIIMGREGDLEGLKLLEQLGAGSVRTGALSMFMAAYRPNPKQLLELLQWARGTGLKEDETTVNGQLDRMVETLSEAELLGLAADGVEYPVLLKICAQVLCARQMATGGDYRAKWDGLLASGITPEVLAPTFFTQLAASNPKQAATIANEDWVPQSSRLPFYAAVSNQLFRKDPSRALEWLNTVPADEEIGKAVAGGVGDWVFGDPKRAGDLIGPLADSSGRRAAVRALIEYYQASGDADSAGKWEKVLAGK
jgi:hypothetical protein